MSNRGQGRKATIQQVVVKAFESKKYVNLIDLYKIVKDHGEFDSYPIDVLQHRVRSALYNLKKTGIIERTGDRIYKKIDN